MDDARTKDLELQKLKIENMKLGVELAFLKVEFSGYKIENALELALIKGELEASRILKELTEGNNES
ncbi:hypothetical protein NIES4071_109660 (plasmid) [Calothrix sp. NIES-4071]|nr:hypothetical protein NIES4071_109660 [Calothrix sp. NIES-4071]BAZ65226.1 hypothetical protein NIES4105_109590 [Calothrix sp. NIES-4105]